MWQKRKKEFVAVWKNISQSGRVGFPSLVLSLIPMHNGIPHKRLTINALATYFSSLN
jgi:hypothetical protein